MAFNSNDNKQMNNLAKKEGYREASNGNSWIKNDGSFLKPSASGGSWNVNGTKYTSLSDAKKGGRI